MMKIIKTLLFSLLLSISVSVFAAQVNINTADAETLSSQLVGVGETKAQAIITYREANGPFKSAADLANVKGIGEGCLQSGCALIGGETAEMPGMYPKGDYDLAGFCVGIVEKSDLIDGTKVKSGDVMLGLASTGPHSNGYSLIRKVLEVSNADLQMDIDGQPLIDALMAPTKIYVKSEIIYP